ncbi:MAG: flagellar hook-length control protein FliK [Lachnospiraceae bacterium]|nr:flagellar hook-length control protein FliK [Lachnospiraceae bacterium]
MAISTKGINTVDVVSNISKVNPKSKTEEKAADSFSNIMNMTSNSFNKNVSDGKEKNIDSVAPAKDTDKNIPDDKVSGTTANKSENAVKSNSKADNANKADSADMSADEANIKDVKDKTDSDSAEIVDDDFKGVVKELGTTDGVDERIEDVISQFAAELIKLIEDIKDVLEKKLGVSDNELEDVMSSLGLNATDLLNTENISDVVLNIEDASDVDILIDEQLAGLVEDINNLVDELVQNFEAFDIDAADFSDGSTLEEKLIPAELETADNVQVSLRDIVNKADEIAAEDEAGNTEEEDKNYSDISKTADNINDDVKITVNSEVKSQTSSENNSETESFSQAHESIINNLNNAISEVITEDVEGTQGFAEDIQQADILRQVVDEIKVNISTDVTTLDMRLNPESLGRVQITVSSRNGVMEAHIVAENEAAKNAIEANLATLRETFNNQELKVEAVEVTIANYGFFEEEQQGMTNEDNRNNNNSRNNRVDSGADTADEGSSDGQLESEILRAQGSSVSYSI